MFNLMFNLIITSSSSWAAISNCVKQAAFGQDTASVVCSHCPTPSSTDISLQCSFRTGISRDCRIESYIVKVEMGIVAFKHIVQLRLQLTFPYNARFGLAEIAVKLNLIFSK